MFSFENANRPAAIKISSPSKTSGRRVSPNVSNPLSTVLIHSEATRPLHDAKISLRDRKRVAQEYRAFGCGQLADLNAFENLPVAVMLPADL